MPYKDIDTRRAKNNAANKLKYYQNKAKAVEYLGGKCIDCGTTRFLEFDHRNPEEKSYSISARLNNRWETVKLELDKCDLRCVGCHGVRTALQKMGYSDILGEVL